MPKVFLKFGKSLWNVSLKFDESHLTFDLRLAKFWCNFYEQVWQSLKVQILTKFGPNFNFVQVLPTLHNFHAGIFLKRSLIFNKKDLLHKSFTASRLKRVWRLNFNTLQHLENNTHNIFWKKFMQFKYRLLHIQFRRLCEIS